MYQVSKPLFLVAQTPLHAGSGDDLGVVDLPIQRERHTQYPKIEASSLKGALREAFETKLNTQDIKNAQDPKKAKVLAAFGPPSDDMTKEDGTFAACLGFTDARILLFPVKSMKGVFAWVTCPHVLHRFSNELLQSGNKGIDGIPAPEEGEACYTIDTCSNIVKNSDKKNFIVLEEFSFTLSKAEVKVNKILLGKWLGDNIFGQDENTQKYWKEKLSNDIIILSDDDFKAFVEHSTEVITRIKINTVTGTAQDGALFNEEYLPSESIMYSLVLASREFKKDRPNFADAEKTMEFFTDTLNTELENIFQLGGNATLGKGILHAKTI